MGNRLIIFSAANQAAGREPWIMDGVAPAIGNTVLLNVIAGNGGVSPEFFRALGNGKVVFAGTTAAAGRELWVSDGTLGGTNLLLDILPGSNSSSIGTFFGGTTGTGSIPRFEDTGSGQVLFPAVSVNGGASDLWITDGSLTGTFRLLATASVANSGTIGTPIGTLGDGRMLIPTSAFVGGGFLTTLYVTDGTLAGTTALSTPTLRSASSQSQGFAMQVADGRLVFAGQDTSGNGGIYATDGTSAGTMLLQNFSTGFAAGPSDFVRLDANRILFHNPGQTDTNSFGITDGTVAGTVMIANLLPAGTTLSGVSSRMSLGDGRVLFSAFNATSGTEFWVTDGTAGGTSMVIDLRPGSSGGGFTPVMALPGGRILFAADSDGAGSKLWVTNGTAAGTSLAFGPPSVLQFSSSNNILLDDGRLVFTGSESAGNTLEPWITSFTPATTSQLVDIYAGAFIGSSPGFYTAFTTADHGADNENVILGGGAQRDSLNGRSGNNTIFGLGADDTIFGEVGDDVIYGGAGNDLMNGGDGNDVFLVEQTGDKVFERTGGGTDTVFVNAPSWVVGWHVEVVRMGGDAATLYGSAYGEQLVANGARASSVFGGAGDDVLWGGGGPAHLLDGGAGDDIIRSQGGAGTFRGGAGNDQIVVSHVNTTLVENPGEGTDTAWVAVNGWTNGANVEIIRLAAPGANSVTGSDTAEDIVANQAEASALNGMGGNDVLWGSAFADTMNGGAGDDIMRGQGGNDAMTGGSGNDQYVVFSSGASITELPGEGYDIVYVAGNASFVLSAELEEARLYESAVSLTGNAGANLLVGNNAGLASTLDGAGGSDTLWGTAAADRITGGLGDDTIYTQGGEDVLVYAAPGWGTDLVAGFAPGARLDFSGSGITFGQLGISSAGGNTQVSLGNSTILLFGVAQMSVADFIFS